MLMWGHNQLGINMKGLQFYMLDVFAEEKYAGNQLAVFRNTAQLTTSEMQRIANEMHFSETTFIPTDQRKKGGYDVRIFTPNSEIPFAGHPTLGTAYVIRHEIANEAGREVRLNLKVGQIPVTFERDPSGHETIWMQQIPPTFGKTFDSPRIARLLSIDEEDIDKRFPIQQVSTGLPFIITPLKTLGAVKRSRINKEEQSRIAESDETDILVFAPETYDRKNDLNVRVFVDLLGIPEDPATGSANGCLAGYLSRYRYLGDDHVDIRVEQGCEIGRPSLLRLKARKRGSNEHVCVGGHVVMVAEGELV